LRQSTQREGARPWLRTADVDDGALALGHHGGEDGAGDLQHGVDVAVHKGLAPVGAVLHYQEVFWMIITDPNIIHK